MQQSSVPSFLQAPSGAEFRCTRCGYDLSGTPVGGACPECGLTVADSLRHQQSAPRNSSDATASFVLSLLSIVCFGVVLAPIALLIGLRALRDIRGGGYASGSRGLAVAGVIIGSVVFAINAVLILVALFGNL
jgi:hypothetical protein